MDYLLQLPNNLWDCFYFLRLTMKKHFIVTMAILISLFIIIVTDFDYINSFLFFTIMFTIPIFGSFTLRYLHKKSAHHE